VRPALAIPRAGDPIILVVDASSTSVGACAMQRDTEGHEKPIAYLSRKLSPTQMKWSTIEREAFAKMVCYLDGLLLIHLHIVSMHCLFWYCCFV